MQNSTKSFLSLLEIIGFYERIVIIAVQETSNTYSFRTTFKFYNNDYPKLLTQLQSCYF